MQLVLFILLLLCGNAFAGITYNGSADFTSVGTMGNFGTGLDTNYFCTSAWLKSSTTSAMTLFGVLNTGSNTAIQITINQQSDGSTTATGRIFVLRREEAGLARSGGVNTNTGLTDGNWHNLIVCYGNNSSATVYVDGTLQTWVDNATSNADVMANFGFNMYLGARNNRATADQFFNGTITELAMWSSTNNISAGDVTTLNTRVRGRPLLVSTLNGLGGYWKMNDGTSGSASGASVTDYSGNANTGTNTGGTWFDDSGLFSNAPTLTIRKQMTINKSLILK